MKYRLCPKTTGIRQSKFRRSDFVKVCQHGARVQEKEKLLNQGKDANKLNNVTR